MSDANRTAVRIVRETTPGTTPASPRFRELRITGSDLNTEVQTVISNELRDDGNVVDTTRVGLLGQGTVPFELSFGGPFFDEVLPGVLRSDWISAPVRDNDGTADTTISDVNATGGVVTVLTGASTPDSRTKYGSFAVGHLVRFSGFTSNNGLFRCTTASQTVPAFAGAGLVTEAAPPAAARMKVVGFSGAAVTEIAVAIGPNRIVRSSGSLDFTTLGLQPGQWLKISGYGTAGVNGWVRIDVGGTITAASIPLDIVPSGWVADLGTGVTPIFWMGDYIRNGVTPRAFTLEEEFSDLTAPEWHYLRGAQISQVQLTEQAQQLVTGSFEVMAMESADPVTTRFAGATTVAPPNNEVVNTTSDFGQLLESGSPLPGNNFITGFSLSLNSSLRRRSALGVLGSASLGLGRLVVEGTLSMYYGSSAVLTKLRNSTATSLNTITTMPAPAVGSVNRQAIVFDLPRIKFQAGNPSVPGVDSDRMFEPTFRALREPTLGYAIHLQRFEEYA